MNGKTAKIVLFSILFVSLLSGCEDVWHRRDPPAAPNKIYTTWSSGLQQIHSITISWSSVTGATGYRVYRSSSRDGTYSKVGDVTTTSFTDTGLAESIWNYYKVSAYNSYGESRLSSSSTGYRWN